MSPRFGHTELPAKQAATLKRAIRIQWLTLGFLAVAITLVFLVMGSSQAMKAAWIEDMLSLAPPLAFLLAVRIVNRRPTAKYPYGYHRSVGVAHLVAGVALFAMGFFLLIDSARGLVQGEHPTIGSVQFLGNTVWLGWLMMGVMALTIPLPIHLGRVKLELAKDLHDKVLYADADMNKADWTTAVGSIVGVGGIGMGLWWADSAAALFIASGILWDGVKNMRGAITDLMDSRATTFDDGRPHPLGHRVEEFLRALPWVRDAGCRVRDEGHVFHIEAFVVPATPRSVSLSDLDDARRRCVELDWKVQDIVLVPVTELPQEAGGPGEERQSEQRE